MSVFGSNIITKLSTELIGFGATIDGSGAITAITGAVLEYVTAAPTATRNGGSLALRSNGSLYATAGGGVWVLIGGAAAGWNLPDDVAGTWGTTSPKQVSSVYVSASNRFDLVGTAQSGATAVTNPDMRIATGANTITGAVAGSPSGFLQLFSGATDCTNAGGTGGASGAVSLSSGNATSTLGVSGSSGSVSLVSGNSDDANSGNIILTTGTAAATRGVLDINIATIDTQTQATQWLALDNTAAALQLGSTGALNALSYDSTNAAEEWTVSAPLGFRAVNDVSFRIGTAANDRFSLTYLSGANLGSLAGIAITGGGATQATRPFLLATGARVLNDAAGSPASGALTLTSGANTVSFGAGGATGGASGAVTLSTGDTDVSLGANTAGGTGILTLTTGNAAATAGTSGASGGVILKSGTSVNSSTGNVAISTGNVTGGTQASGALTLTTGTSAGGNTGSYTISTGNAAGAGGAITSGGFTLSTGTVGGTGTTGGYALTSGAPVGAGTSGSFSFISGNVAGAGTSGGATLQTGTTATGTTGSIALITGAASGAGTSGSISLTPGVTTGGTRGQVSAVGLRTTSDSATSITTTRTLSLADSGGTFSVSQAAAYDIDLPSPIGGAGLRFIFFLGVAAANSVTITVAGGAATFIGTIANDVTSTIPATGSTLTFVSGTAALGDNIEIYSIATNLYGVRAVTSTAGGITVA